MKRGFTTVAVLVLGWASVGVGHACGVVRERVVEASCAARSAVREYLAPAFKLERTTDELIRADLLRPQPLALAAPTARAVRPTRDQRPALRLFTLPRADFAY